MSDVLAAKPSQYFKEKFYFTWASRHIDELDRIARNIVNFLEHNGDEWKPFSKEDYASFNKCDAKDIEEMDKYGYHRHNDDGTVQKNEDGTIKRNENFLSKNSDGTFQVTQSFLNVIDRCKNLLLITKPSQYDRSNTFMGSHFGRSETEQIASNIIFILKKSGDEWKPFSQDDYTNGCTHKVTGSEFSEMDSMVRNGYLKVEGGKYQVTSSFCNAIKEFIDTPQRREKIAKQFEEAKKRGEEYKKNCAEEKLLLISLGSELEGKEDIPFSELQEIAGRHKCRFDKYDRGEHRWDRVRIDFVPPYSGSHNFIGQGFDLQQATKQAIKGVIEKSKEIEHPR